MAYATIAELPVQIGLYTCMAPMVVYALLGGGRALSVSTTSTIAVLVAATIAGLPEDQTSSTSDALAAAFTLTFLVGICLLALRLLRLGGLVEMVSPATLTGIRIGRRSHRGGDPAGGPARRGAIRRRRLLRDGCRRGPRDPQRRRRHHTRVGLGGGSPAGAAPCLPDPAGATDRRGRRHPARRHHRRGRPQRRSRGGADRPRADRAADAVHPGARRRSRTPARRPGDRDHGLPRDRAGRPHQPSTRRAA